MDHHNKRQRFIFWGIVLGIALAVLTLTPVLLKAKNKSLLWVGLGEAEGKYEEDLYQIESEVRGETWEYSEFSYFEQKNHQSLIPSSAGPTRGFFVHYTLFNPSFEDQEERTHDLSFTEIIPYWSRGYQYIVHIGKKLNWHTSVEAFLGIGFITFEKEIENYYKFDYKWGYDLGYGYGMNSFFSWDDGTWILGWKSSVHNNRITLEYNENQGYLTHRRNIMFFIGLNVKGQQSDCVPTAYVVC